MWLLLFVSLLCTGYHSLEVHVGPQPNSAYPHVSHCLSSHNQHSGPTDCILHAGVYYDYLLIDSSTVRNTNALTFRAAPGERVTMSGLYYLPKNLQWEKRHQKVFCTNINKFVNTTASSFEQVFYDDQMMVEARWPNLKSQADLLSKDSWQPTSTGSRYGKIVTPALSKTGIDWTGALATLNVAHQFFTWTRFIVNTSAGSDTIHYPKNLPGITDYAKKVRPWEYNQFYLSGKYEALDYPGEWWFNRTGGDFCMWPPHNTTAPPRSELVGLKVRNFAYDINNKNNVKIEGINFFATTVRCTNCENFHLTSSKFEYPSYNREIPEGNPPGHKGKAEQTEISGVGAVVKNVTFKYTSASGLRLDAPNSLIHNVLVYSTCWLGTLWYPAMSVDGQNTKVENVTASYFGNAGIVTTRIKHVRYSLVHHGGLIGLDTAGLYTQGEAANGTSWNHNWVHTVTEKCARGDDQTRNLTIHHNVFFDCGVPLDDKNKISWGLVIKGDYNDIYANTIFRTKVQSICIPACKEPYKPWKPHQLPRILQNRHSHLVNTALESQSGKCSCSKVVNPVPGGHDQADYTGNYTTFKLRNIAGYDFRPGVGSPLIGAGVPYPPNDITPVDRVDVGAYQHDAAVYWIPGCSNDALCQHQVVLKN